MLKYPCIVAALLLAFPGLAQPTYLPQASIAAAQARSAALWQSVQCQPQPTCDAAQITKYLLLVQPLTDGTAALVVPAGAALGALAVNPVTAGVAALTPAEQATVASVEVMGVKLPWIVTVAQIEARLTAGQLNALNNSTDPTVMADWAALKAGATVDLTSAQAIGLVQRAVTLGLLNATQATAVLAWVAVAAVP